MSKKAQPPTNYFGGKYGTIGEFIASILPEHKFYIEPYGGMAGVLFHKKPSLVEVYNDLDKRIVTLLRVIRDEKKFKYLIKLLKNTPFAREEYIEACRSIKSSDNLSDVEIAFCTYIALSMAIQPSLRWNGFRQGGLKYETSVARGFKKKIELLESTKERLRGVIIENIPAIKLMLKYNSSDVLLYLDPPYVHNTRFSKNDYGVEMDDLDHLEMLCVVKNLKCKVLISGYPNELYNTELSGWDKFEIGTTSAISASNSSENSSKRVEVLWANFKINKQTELF